MKTLKPLLSSSSRLTTLSRSDRRKIEPGREWYNTNEWKRLRLKVFDRDLYTCQYVDKKTFKKCGKLEGNTSKLIAHHRKSHKGNRELFFDIENLMTVCKDCHDGPIASEERTNSIAGTWY